MAPLHQQWDSILAVEPSDWSHMSLELRLEDPDRTEDACTILSPLNPWRRDDDWRTGILRFQVARVAGYGAAAPLVRTRLAVMEARGLTGTLRVLRSVDAVRLVATQGPT